MKNKQKKKSFDAVKMMRQIRDKITSETQDMTLEQLRKYMADQRKRAKLKPIGS
jgi:hypothetical protein